MQYETTYNSKSETYCDIHIHLYFYTKSLTNTIEINLTLSTILACTLQLEIGQKLFSYFEQAMSQKDNVNNLQTQFEDDY